jgi:hypothetical protein
MPQHGAQRKPDEKGGGHRCPPPIYASKFSNA